MKSSVATGRKRLIKKVEQIQDEALLHAIETLIAFANQKDESYLGESLSDYNLALNRADAEISKGRFVAHEKAVQRIGSWRKREK
ncbi:MAG: hypothetical protein ACK5V5_07530 [Cyclobacteriaceae bacterium]|jgi:predicted transcriptional regulator|nr:hypothetical protein [Flammeovirgaceae bacterium]